MKIFDTVLKTLNSNSIVDNLVVEKLQLINISFEINNLTINQLITIYGFHGEILEKIPVTQAVKINIRYGSISKIVFSDSNHYAIYLSEQIIKCDNEREYAELFLEQKFDLSYLRDINAPRYNQFPQSLNDDGSLSIGGSVTFTNDTIGVSGTVEISSGSVTFTNTSIDISGIVAVQGTVEVSSGTVTFTNDSIGVSGTVEISSGSVTFTNTSIDISGIVAVQGTVEVSSGTVTFTNDSIGVSGTVEISSGSVALTNDTININLTGQSIAMATFLNMDQESFSANSRGWSTQPTYIEFTFTIDANTYVKFKNIYFQANNSEGIILTDDTTSSNNAFVCGNTALNIFNGLIANPVYESNNHISLGKFGQVTFLNLATGSNPDSQAIITFGALNYDRTLLTGSNSATVRLKLSVNNRCYMALQIDYEFLGTVKASMTTNGSPSSTPSSSGGGGGGGCFTKDLLIISRTGIKQFWQIKEGDEILTPSGFRKIDKIYDMGIQEIYMYEGLKVSPSQPFLVDGKKVLAKDCGIRMGYSERTYDLHVDGLWFYAINKNGKMIELMDLYLKIP
jgi:lipopolysaccharide export system protein LptA